MKDYLWLIYISFKKICKFEADGDGTPNNNYISLWKTEDDRSIKTSIKLLASKTIPLDICSSCTRREPYVILHHELLRERSQHPHSAAPPTTRGRIFHVE